MKKRIWKWTGLFLAAMLVCMTAGAESRVYAQTQETAAKPGSGEPGVTAGTRDSVKDREMTQTGESPETFESMEIPGITEMPGMEELSGTGSLLGAALFGEQIREEQDSSEEGEEGAAGGEAEIMEPEAAGSGQNPEENREEESAGNVENGEITQEEGTQNPAAEENSFSSGEEGYTNEENQEDSKKSETGEPETLRKASLKLLAEQEEAEPKAGQTLLYNVTLENTGDLPLNNLSIRPDFREEGLTGSWDTSEGLKTAGTEALLDSLEPGEIKLLYLTAVLPESFAGAVNLSLKASAGVEGDSDSGTGTVTDSAENTVKVTALTADFEVTKTADRTAAVPGDRILFQICIRNTGERTLHSVITTEKFKLQGVPVEFLEKEGITLNNTKTKARIEAIEPGQAVSLQAVVALPENIRSQELINEIGVTAAETGERIVVSQAKVQIYGAAENETEKSDTGAETMEAPEEKAMAVSAPPKTGDSTPVFSWMIVLAAAAAALAVCGGYFRKRRRGSER